MQPSEMTNDEIRQELSKIAIDLTDLPADDFSRRVELRDRRAALREEIGRRPISEADVVSIKREMVGLQKRLHEILDDRPNIGAMGDSGEGERGTAENQQFGWDYDEGTGRNAIQERLQFLQVRLSRAEGD